MDAQPTALIAQMFDELEAEDPRADNARHGLTDMLVIALLAVICGADDYPGVVEFGRDQLDWLKTFLALPHGIPSVSTFRRLFAALRPAALAGWMNRWAVALAGSVAGKQIALDGKTLRRSFAHAWDKSGPLHLVTAWCVEERLVLAQQAVDAKGNEITAVPELLKALDVRGAVVSGDAMNTQKEIAASIVRGGGDYVLAVKDNHPTLCDCVSRHLDEMILEKFNGVPHAYHESTEAGHGRIDTRRVWATDQIDWLTNRGDWTKLASVVAVESRRERIGQPEKTTRERRYFITSLPCASGSASGSGSGERFARLVRNHWSIENGQHWVLDVAFDEDQSRVRTDHGDQNMAALRRIALGLLRRDKSVKLGAKNKRLKACRNRNYLLRVLLPTMDAK